MSLENPRGIPKADFVEDIPGLMEKTSLTAAELIEQADTQYNKVSVSPQQTEKMHLHTYWFLSANDATGTTYDSACYFLGGTPH